MHSSKSVFENDRTHLLSSLGVLSSDVDEEIDDTARVTPLVIVPGDELQEVLVQLDTGVGIEDGGVGVAGEIGGDDGVFGVAEDTLELTLGGLLDGSLDLFVGRGLLDADDEIDDGDIDGGDTERETTTSKTTHLVRGLGEKR